ASPNRKSGGIHADFLAESSRFLSMGDSPAIRKSFLSFFPPVLLIAVACLINYVDRGNLSIAASTIQTDPHIPTGNLGVLLAAFFYAYTAFIFISGWLVDRFSANWIF